MNITRNVETISAMASCWYKGNILFFDNLKQAICLLDIEKNELSIINELFEDSYVAMGIFLVDNNAFFFPHFGSKVMKYDLDVGCFSIYGEKDAMSSNGKPNTAFVLFGQYVYRINAINEVDSMGRIVFNRFSFSSCKWDYVFVVPETDSKLDGGEALFVCPSVSEGVLYAVERKNHVIISVNFSVNNYKLYSSDNNWLDASMKCEGRFYITHAHDRDIEVVNLSGEREYIDISDDIPKQEVVLSYSYIYNCGENVIFLPRFGRYVLIIKKSDLSSSLIQIAKEDKKEGGSYCLNCIMKENTVWLIPLNMKKIVKINMVDYSWEWIEVKYSEDSFIKMNRLPRGILKEGEAVESFESFLGKVIISG